MFEKFYIDANAFHLAIIAPSYQEMVPGQGADFKSSLQGWTMMSGVPSKAPIVSLNRNQNILQRRDASCDLVYKKLFGTTTRSITTDELYAATKFCRNEFYQGALKDWRNGDPLFGNKIQPWFESAIRTDMVTNGYFGDITRAKLDTYQFATSEYDGVWKWIAKFYAAGIIPSTQTMSMPNVDMRGNPAQAYAVVKGLYDKQNPLMRSYPDGDKEFTVSQPILDGLAEYYRTVGGTGDTLAIIGTYQNGVKVYSYNNIRIVAEPFWEPVLLEINPSNQPNAAILTLKKNFVGATDENYGEGPDGKTALAVWYSWEQMSWVYQMFLKFGTAIAVPEHIVFSI